MVEDMKGKIRVYCRSRPLSSDELARVSRNLHRSRFFKRNTHKPFYNPVYYSPVLALSPFKDEHLSFGIQVKMYK